MQPTPAKRLLRALGVPSVPGMLWFGRMENAASLALRTWLQLGWALASMFWSGADEGMNSFSERNQWYQMGLFDLAQAPYKVHWVNGLGRYVIVGGGGKKSARE
jgi:hypothetical protein